MTSQPDKGAQMEQGEVELPPLDITEQETKDAQFWVDTLELRFPDDRTGIVIAERRARICRERQLKSAIATIRQKEEELRGELFESSRLWQAYQESGEARTQTFSGWMNQLVIQAKQKDDKAFNDGVEAAATVLDEWKRRTDYIQGAGFFGAKARTAKRPAQEEKRQ